MTSPTIRPARGLWAAAMPDGEIVATTISASKSEASAWLSVLIPRAERALGWSALAACGWRIIRVDVIPHEGSDQL